MNKLLIKIVNHFLDFAKKKKIFMYYIEFSKYWKNKGVVISQDFDKISILSTALVILNITYKNRVFQYTFTDKFGTVIERNTLLYSDMIRLLENHFIHIYNANLKSKRDSIKVFPKTRTIIIEDTLYSVDDENKLYSIKNNEKKYYKKIQSADPL